MSPDAIASVVAAIATGGFAAWGARSARRTKQQERRDDFTVFVKELRTELKDVKADLVTQKAEAARQQDQITGQGAAISWLVVDRRSLMGYIRRSGLEPPASKPIPDRARTFLDHFDL